MVQVLSLCPQYLLSDQCVRKLATSQIHVKLNLQHEFLHFFIIWKNSNNNSKTHGVCKVAREEI